MATGSHIAPVLRIHSQAGKEAGGEQEAAEAYDALAESRKPPSIVARVTSQERFRSNDTFGDLSGPALAVILQGADKGDVAQWAMFAEFAISSDETLQSLYTSRLTRVAQAEYEVVADPHAAPERARLAEAAAAFVSRQMARIENWETAFPLILHAIAIGYSASEMEWQYDEREGVYFVVRIKERHPRRFRYGKQWDLRLYDRGARRGADGYGEMLRPDLWIVHEHREVMGYQGVGGVMRSCALAWLLKRWAVKFWIGHVEKFASPIVYGKVQPDTPPAARTSMLEGMQNLSADHTAVIENTGDIVVVPTSQSTGGGDQHEKFINKQDAGMAKAWLGSGDSIESGPNGARAATETRMGATADPRMVSDGKRVCASLRGSLIKWLIAFNAEHICAMAGVEAEEASGIPLPVMQLLTAHDEVSVDAGDAANEAQQGQPGAQPGTPEYGGSSLPPQQPGQPIDVAAIVRESIAATTDAGREERKALSELVMSLAETVKTMATAEPTQARRARPKRPKASASGEPRQLSLTAGSATTPSPTPSTSLETRIANLLRERSATPEG